MANEAPGKEELRTLLRGAGLRATIARVAVLQTLMKERVPLSHGEVYDRVGDQGFDRATVYRNLVDLAEAGLLSRADLGDHVWRFELLDEGGHAVEVHPHFVCTDCGTVACLPSESVAVRATRGSPKSLRRRGTFEVNINGLCDACA
jgi:Fur family transcriptional regulator, ferric uptake regulator